MELDRRGELRDSHRDRPYGAELVSNPARQTGRVAEPGPLHSLRAMARKGVRGFTPKPFLSQHHTPGER